MNKTVEVLGQLNLSSRGIHAHDEFLRALIAISEHKHPENVLEVGGGRSPIGLDLGLGDVLTVSDVSSLELSYLAPGVRQICFDICDRQGIPASSAGTFDLVFSQSVLEHVNSIDAAMENCYSLLREGGVAFHYFPTLYSSPFVLNKVLPFRLTYPIVKAILKPAYERFPGYYRQARSTSRQLESWKSLGFEIVYAHRFYDHGYYRRIPIVRSIESRLSAIAERRNWYWYSSYAFVLLIK